MNIRVVYGMQKGKMLEDNGTINGSNAPEEYHVLPATDVNMSPDMTKQESEAFTSSRFRADGYVSRVAVSGSLETELSRLLLMDMLPNVSFKDATPDPGPEMLGTVFIPKISVSRDYMMIVVEDLEQQSCDIYYDCLTNNFALNIAKEVYVTASFDLMGTKAEVRDGRYDFPSTPIDAKASESLRALDIAFGVDGSDVSHLLSTLTLSIDNALEDRAPINSPFTNRIVSTGTAGSTMDVTYDWYRKQEYISYFGKSLDNTAFTGEITLVTPNGADAGKKVTISMPNMKANSVSRGDLTGAGTVDTSFDIYFNDSGKDEIAKAPLVFAFE